MSSTDRDLGKELFDASKEGEFDKVRELLAAGARLDYKDGNGNTALHVAANSDVVRVLLSPEESRPTEEEPERVEVQPELADEQPEPAIEEQETTEDVQPAETSQPTLTINGTTLPWPPSDEAVDPSRSNYVLVQSRGRLSSEEKGHLNSLGLVFHEYISKNTYLCRRRDNADLDGIRQYPAVVSVYVYHVEFKLSPDLNNAQSSRPYKVDVLFHQGVDTRSKDIRDPIEKKSHRRPDELAFSPRKVRLTIRGKYLEDLASIDAVRRIEEVRKPVPFDRPALNILQVDAPPGVGAEQQVPYKGAEQVIAIADTGLDLYHPAFVGRIQKVYQLGDSPPDDFDGHGTHVCGLAVGNDLGNTNLPKGSAPQAKLIMQCLGRDLEYTPDDISQLFAESYEDGARVHSNSWGSDGEPNYRPGTGAEAIDHFVRKHSDMVICFAAGNSGYSEDGHQVRSSPMTGEARAKNCITVGASENNRPDINESYGQLWPDKFPMGPVSMLRVANNPQSVAAISTRGDAGRRTKPDVVAPGTQILSACSQHVPNPGPLPLWRYMCGTSMATPLVAGCAAALREALIVHGIQRPSAALVKALLINGADTLPAPATRADAGFGRVNLARSLHVVHSMSDTSGFYDGEFRTEGDKYLHQIPLNSQCNLKATLVWLDPRGDQIRNVLTLDVEHSSKETHRDYDPSNYDDINNAQQVVWPGMEPGHVTLRVTFVSDDRSGENRGNGEDADEDDEDDDDDDEDDEDDENNEDRENAIFALVWRMQ